MGNLVLKVSRVVSLRRESIGRKSMISTFSLGCGARTTPLAPPRTHRISPRPFYQLFFLIDIKMKRLTTMILALFCWTVSIGQSAAWSEMDLQVGDLVFQKTGGQQSQAVEKATRSPWTHCGILVLHKGLWWVYEASRQVVLTPLDRFIGRSVEGKWAIYRSKTQVSGEQWKRGVDYASRQLGKPYDLNFAWDEDKQYCSELVWKTYRAAGVELCTLKNYQDYELDSPEVRQLIAHRYGSVDRLPAGVDVVAPSDLSESKLLVKIYSSPN